MKNKFVSNRLNSQKKYRQAQAKKGLVRYEIQVEQSVKELLEEMVAVEAESSPAPWDKRKRLAKARADLFKKFAQGGCPTFHALKERIQQLEEEIKALSPTFFDKKIPSNTPLPTAIDALPNHPKHLKALLAKTYQEAQQAKRSAIEQKRKADQYLELYEVASEYNDELKTQLEKDGVTIDD